MIDLKPQGTVYYGMHFVPGVCEYRPAGKDAFRVYVSDAVMREMGPTFAGRPVFVGHIDSERVARMSKEEACALADGWVIESFFNPADGKHWAKFVVVSKKGQQAIDEGLRLSNAYHPVLGAPGTWNMVDYDHEVIGGDYNHMALVDEPRYEESVVLTPDEFKAYNDEKSSELRELANSKKGDVAVKVNLFRRTKVEKLENGTDLESLVVRLASGRELSITELVNEAEKADEAKKKPRVADGEDLINMGEGKESLTVNGLLEKYNSAVNEVEAYKLKNAEGETDEDETDEDEDVENEADEDDELENDAEDGDGDDLENGEDCDMQNSRTVDQRRQGAAGRQAAGRRAADPGRARARALENASERTAPKRETAHIDLASDQVSRGKARYGS